MKDGPAPRYTVEELRVYGRARPVTHTRCRAAPAKPTRIPAANVQLCRYHEPFRKRRDRMPDEARSSRMAASFRLPYHAPYDWDAILSFLALRAIPGVESMADAGYARTAVIDGQPGTVFVRPGRGAFLNVTAHFSMPIPRASIAARVQRLFDLNADPKVIGAHLSRDRRLAPLVAARPGLRVPGAWDGFELGVRAILGQQITVMAARGLAAQLAARLGEQITHPHANALGLTHVFPDAVRVAAADLSTLGMPRARIAWLQALARAHLMDPSLFEAPTSAMGNLDEVIRKLRSLKGIGEWTAHYIAMRQLREPDAFPVGDVALMRALANAKGVRPTARQMLARAERWRPWRAYAALHLWASLA
jgi:AraC family transcriptional regulator, regulatory protein of adaptative response / DNA-3-methyladenine glycosylase II